MTEQKTQDFNFKIFNMYSLDEINVEDPGLKPVINLTTKIILGSSTGKYTKNMMIVLGAFKIIEEKTKTNPVKVLVKAIENSAPRDETTVIEYGGARDLQAVDVSPLRRVNIALKNLVHGASDRAFNKKKNITQSLAEEIILAYENSGDSSAVRKKNEAEKQADSAR